MSRKLIIIIVIAVIVVFGAWIYEASQKTAAVPGQQKSLLSTLFPFGSGNPTTTENGTATGGGNSGTPEDGSTAAPTPVVTRLTRLTDKMVAGFTVLPTPKDSGIPEFSVKDPGAAPITLPSQIPVARFAEKGTGYIYDVNAKGDGGKKVSGTVIARTAQAIFADNGNTAILRYIKDDNQTVATFWGQIQASTLTSLNDGTLKGDFLPDNIPDITVSEDEKSILFLLPTADGVAGISMKSDGTGKKQIFKSAFTEWLLDWPLTGPVLTSKPNADTPGYAYLIGTTGSVTGVFQKVIGNVNGLTTKMSPDGKMLLYSVSGGQGMSLHVLRMKEGTDTNTGLQTFPEKCVWTADSTTVYCGVPATAPRLSYPDAWYQGLVQFDDAFWKVDAGLGTTTSINNGEGDDIDSIDVALDQNNKYLFMTDKTGGALWSLDLTPIPVATPILPGNN